MKETIAIFGLLIGLTIISCSQNDLNRDSNLSVNTSKINQVLNEKVSEIQKLMYSSLNPEEKLFIWNRKISVLLNDEKLNTQQKELLTELKNNLTSDVFDQNVENYNRTIFKTVYSVEFLEKANELFNKEYILKSFYELTSMQSSVNFKSVTSNCNCSKASAVTCALGGTQESPLICGTAKCKVKSESCGWLWQYDCDGQCKSVIY